MWQRPFYHEGMSELQDRFDGRRVAEAIERHRKHYEFWDDEKEMIETSPFFFIGTSWNDYIDCNIKSGDPGFVKIMGPNIIEYPEYDGNSMYRTLGKFREIPTWACCSCASTARAGACASMAARRSSKMLRRWAGISARKWWCGSSARSIRTVRAMCPISPARKLSPYVPREGQEPPPPPEWKRRDYIRDILPSGDPHAEVVKASG